MLVDRKKQIENWEGSKRYEYGIPKYKQKETPDRGLVGG